MTTLKIPTAMLTRAFSVEQGRSDDRERRLRDSSFSSYLTGGNEECCVINFSKKSFDSGDDEIDVFSAEKYFNERLNDVKQEIGEKSVVMIPPVQDLMASAQPKAKSGASSLRSASSWNSQSALLLARRNPLANGKSRARGRGYLGSFRCRCVCADKNSVTVDEDHSSVEAVTQSAAKDTQKRGVSQCMPNQGGPEIETYPTPEDLSVVDLRMKERKSLEIFGSASLERRRKPFCFETERNLRTLNHRPEVMSIGADPGADSDASSDLFEIEDFTRKVNPFLTRIISGSATYAPSEASIEWSVDTATASDYDKVRSCKKPTSTGMNLKDTATGGKPGRRSSSFLGCNSQDSVKVVDHAYTTSEKKPETKIVKSQDLPAKVYKAQTDAKLKLTGFEMAGNMGLGVSSLGGP